jgi:hypothetical protein
MITSLCRAIVNGHPFRNDKKDSDDKRDLSNTDDTEPKLLILLDEYDAPVRDSLLPLVGSNLDYVAVRQAYSDNFEQYCALMNSFKAITAMTGITTKVWITGISPVGFNLLGRVFPVDLTWDPVFADAVGLLEGDVERILDAAEKIAYAGDTTTSEEYKKNETEQIAAAVKKWFIGMVFPGGSELYHTRRVNQLAIDHLSTKSDRAEWLAEADKTSYAMPTSAVAPIILALRDCQYGREALLELASGKEVKGSIRCGLSLLGMLEDEVLRDDALTLLTHLGVVSARGTRNKTVSVFHMKGIVRRLWVHCWTCCRLG